MWTWPAGLTFPRAMRALLRQDPDVIMCGEIRDFETGELALQAALTGHLVLTAMHAATAARGVSRLVEVGLWRYGLADALLGVLAQRLVRRLCPACRQERPPTVEETRWLRQAGVTEIPATVGTTVGCEQCQGRGYRGRIAIHELFLMNDEIRHLLQEGASLPEIEHAAGQGMRTMRRDAAEKVVQGLTDVSEAARVTGAFPDGSEG